MAVCDNPSVSCSVHCCPLLGGPCVGATFVQCMLSMQECSVLSSAQAWGTASYEASAAWSINGL